MREKKKRGKDGRSGKSSGPNPILVGITLIIAAVIAWYVMNRRGGGGGEDQALEVEDVADGMENLGRVLALGPGFDELAPEGTELVKVDAVKGLQKLLDGPDVQAVIDALVDAKLTKVLVDPSLAVRNPLPRNTVLNRLALARPTGRLSAKLMSKQYFRFELDEPPPALDDAAMLALTRIARKAAGAEDPTGPDKRPSVIEEDGEWSGILTLRRVQGPHLSFHSGNASTLAELAKELGEKAARYYRRKGFADRYGPLPEALTKELSVELEVAYDEGTFVGPRDNVFLWRVIEPGIYGVRMKVGGKLHQLPPWYTITNNYRTVTSMLERLVHRMGGEEKDYWKDETVPIQRFRTIHWREQSPGGSIQELYRAMPRVPSTKDVTKENLIASIKGLGDWLADNQVYPSGRYIYRYFPTKDEENEEYNIVRHALGPFSLALTHEWVPNPIYKEKAEAGMRFMEERIRWGGAPRTGTGEIDESTDSWMGKPLPGPEIAILDFEEPPNGGWSCKMGAVAVAILGYTQYKRVGWELSPEREKVLEGLANFLLYMQKEDGSFHHYYVARQNHYYGTRNSIYPGEILYAIARLYGETRDERYRKVFKESMRTNLEWFRAEMDQKEPDGTYAEDRRKNLVQFQPWIAMAMEEMHRYDPDPEYVAASNEVSLWILDTYQYDETRAMFPDKLGGYLKVLDELPAMHTFVYTEGTAASYMLARKTGADPAVVQKLRRGALLAARFILQMQVREGENDYFYPNPKKARGAVRYCMNHNKQRIDYTYHALSSVYRILHAATPEDYAYVQSIPMPERW